LKNSEPKADALVHFFRAEALLKLGKPKEALPDLDRAIELNPEFLRTRRSRGFARLTLGDMDAAKLDYDMVLAREPENPSAHYGLGVISYAKRDWQNASQHFTALRNQSPQSADAAVWSILARKRAGQTVSDSEFQAIDRTQWPGHVVAHLLGQVGPLDKFIEDASARNDPNLGPYICVGTFATFSLVQIEGRLEATTEDYKKIKPGHPYLDDIQEIYDKCADYALEGRVGQNEIAYLRAR